MSNLFDSELNKIPEEIKNYTDLSFEIVDQIHEILESKGKTQKDLADMLGKSESEISKWMRGTHNFTIKSIAKIEAVLGEKIIITPVKLKQEIIGLLSDTLKISLSKEDIFGTTVVYKVKNTFVSEKLSIPVPVSQNWINSIYDESIFESYAMVA